jgi:HAD superfamily hydrolase (TIGR01458 family)
MQSAFKALFLDLSGVLYEGEHPMPGAANTVNRAREKGWVLRFVTNTATKDSRFIFERLIRLGIPIHEGELFTAPTAARHHIKHHGFRPYCLVHEAIRHDFDELDQQNPNCVLIGDAQDGLNYRSLNRAFQICKAGAPLIGIGMNKYFKDDRGLNLDAGPFIRAIEWAADIQAIIMGKPSQAFFDEIVDSTPFKHHECLMVGDDVLGDVVGATNAGLQGCLVRTGKYKAGDERHLNETSLVIDSIADLIEDQAL